MIITRTPFRLPLGGGGTDLPSYYSKYGGFIFSAGLDKYMFIDVNGSKVDDLIRLKYSKSEIVERVEDIEHDIAREALKMMEIKKGIEISSIADVPAGTGLGSSSCYAVGLLNALHALKRDYVSRERLAEEACRIEIDIMGKPIGKQDQYLAALGGFTVLDIARDGKVAVRRAEVSDEIIDALNSNILLFYTGVTRSADVILAHQSAGAASEKKDIVESMHFIKELGYKILEAVERGNIDDVGLCFDQHWEYKKKISTQMSNPRFDEIYSLAKQSGALGGKISGAGGGGFFTFYVPKNHADFRVAMKKNGLREMRYHFDFEGSKVLVDF